MNKIIALSSLLILSSCNVLFSSNNSELEAQMNRIIQDQKPNVAPIREVLEPIEFVYDVSEKRSPFQPEEEILRSRPNPVSDVKPILNRPPQLLESVRIENIRMSGTMQGENGKLVALVDVSGTNKYDAVYTVKVGDYLGKNHGRILQITDLNIAIEEIVSQGKDQWQKRQRTLSLQDQ